MYIEYDETKGNSVSNVLALDWDETTSDYPLAFREIAKNYERVIIITVNDELTVDDACRWLNRKTSDLEIFCCPDDNIDDVPGWKSEVCCQHQVALMFDDNPDVVRACHLRGINAICVSERVWKFDNLQESSI
ncbi:hypothetical protein [Pleionea sediminis]|uniref:hypothetical protein n=1 Tax=Pleionea sediminis TaxID=2569479 RepID=UPI00118476D9|nr:hypothetical protein [Pleionea sediminis]